MHRVDAEDVHFHEVGALDAIADVVGVAAGLHALGLERLTAGPVTVGSGGTARSGHGVIPVPAPAVLGILAEAGAPVRGGPAPYEMCTPTGAALLAAAVTGWGPLPELVPVRTGVGAGGRDPAELPNVVRLVLGRPVGAPTTAVRTRDQRRRPRPAALAGRARPAARRRGQRRLAHPDPHEEGPPGPHPARALSTRDGRRRSGPRSSAGPARSASGRSRSARPRWTGTPAGSPSAVSGSPPSGPCWTGSSST